MSPDVPGGASLFIASINSGSNGNCYYVGTATEAVLIDAGLSCKETERRMDRLGLPVERVKALFVSHEHTDHVRGLEMVSKRWNLPVWGTPATLGRCRLGRSAHRAMALLPETPVPVGELLVTGFTKRHDAVDPISFTIESRGVTVGVFTDIGRACERLAARFAACHAAFLEANYCEAMLEEGRYPWHLKQRIRGGHGHLSNREALEVFLKHRSPALSHLLLAHLSQENNHPEVALDLFRPHAGATQVTVASRWEESPVHCIRAASVTPPAPGKALEPKRRIAVQMPLF